VLSSSSGRLAGTGSYGRGRLLVGPTDS